MKNVRLNNGVMMPAIGFGIFQIPENETERIVNDAIETGYRKFDTAASYFNEEQLGNAIRHSGMKREEFFITTKLWVQDYEYDDALRAFEQLHDGPVALDLQHLAAANTAVGQLDLRQFVVGNVLYLAHHHQRAVDLLDRAIFTNHSSAPPLATTASISSSISRAISA